MSWKIKNNEDINKRKIIRSESSKGESYIKHKEREKTILLFVREQNEDELGFTISYVFLGEADFANSTGAKPMNIEWKLKEPMPAYLWSGKAGSWLKANGFRINSFLRIYQSRITLPDPLISGL